MPTALDRARENATGIVSTLVTGLWLVLLISGVEYWLAVMLLGYIVVIPITGMLFGDDEESESESSDMSGPWQSESSDERTTETTDPGNTDDAIQELRGRYARGEITEEQFERKVERLLETDSVESANEHMGTQDDERERESELS
jgi:hypothetical protein